MDRPPRRYPRLSSRHTLLVTRVGQPGLDQFAKTHTVGLGGCGFVSEEDLGVGTLIELMISIRPRAIKVAARVVYQFSLPDGSYEVGVEFLALDDQERSVLQALFADEPLESSQS